MLILLLIYVLALVVVIIPLISFGGFFTLYFIMTKLDPTSGVYPVIALLDLVGGLFLATSLFVLPLLIILKKKYPSRIDKTLKFFKVLCFSGMLLWGLGISFSFFQV